MPKRPKVTKAEDASGWTGSAASADPYPRINIDYLMDDAALTADRDTAIMSALVVAEVMLPYYARFHQETGLGSTRKLVTCLDQIWEHCRCGSVIEFSGDDIAELAADLDEYPSTMSSRGLGVCVTVATLLDAIEQKPEKYSTEHLGYFANPWVLLEDGADPSWDILGGMTSVLLKATITLMDKSISTHEDRINKLRGLFRTEYWQRAALLLGD